MRHMGRTLAAALLVLAGAGARLDAQRIAPRPEFRADILGAAPYSVQVGGGVNLGAGYYQRVELDAAGGRSAGMGYSAAPGERTR